MSNMKVWEERGSSATGIERLFLRIPIGANGAPGTAIQSWGFGATPLTRTGVGVYTVNLGHAYPATTSLRSYTANTVQSTVTAGDGVMGVITAEAYNQATPTLTLTMISSNTGVAAEIANGATLLMELVFKNTAVNP